MSTSVPFKKSPLQFFLLVFVLAIPFWLIGVRTGIQLLPGLPIAALMFICPMMAALILVYREHKGAGVAELLKRSYDFKRIRAKVWYAPILLLMPGVAVLSYGVMRLTGTPVPTPQIVVLPALALFITFFICAFGEELGWSGYVIDPMQNHWSALVASILLGLVWAIWHIVPLLQARRSVAWIAWWSLGTVAARVIMVWLYNNTGRSVFGAALFHATANISWQLFPIHGSFYDPRIHGPIMAVVAAIVVVDWGPRTLARLIPVQKSGCGKSAQTSSNAVSG